SICPKHASIRLDNGTNKVEILDLCSIHGVTVDQSPIAPVSWIEITTKSRLVLGSVPAFVVEGGEGNKKADVSYLQDEDSLDVIDCSLEETPSLQGSRKITHTTVGLSGASSRPSTLIETKATVHQPVSPVTCGKNDRTSSFIVPETQQLSDSRVCNMEDTAPVSNGVPLANALDDEDDSFFIPETQQPEDELGCASEVIEPILPCAKGGPVERTETDEEYFQMMDDDDGNSNDAIFNNKYVEESQNLMLNLDESYKAAVEPRVSIIPERSVDSISFQEHRNTTMEMSKIEWNESKKESETTPAVSKPMEPSNGGTIMASARKSINEMDDRSSTPDLNFDDDAPKPVENGPSVAPEIQSTVPDRSITPDLNFDDDAPILVENGPSAAPEIQSANGTDVAHAHPLADAIEPNRSSETPELCFDEQENEDNEHEISLNQEGCFLKPNDASEKTEAIKVNGVSRVENIYEVETQPVRVEDDAYDLLTQPLQLLPTKSGSVDTRKRKQHVQEPYDLQTQPMNVERKSSLTVKSVHDKSAQSPEIDYANLPTQPSPPEFADQGCSSFGGIAPANMAYKLKSLSLKKKSLFDADLAKLPPSGNSKSGNAKTPSHEIDYANLPTQPETPPELAFPPLSNGRKDMVGQLASNSRLSIDDDDLLTQPLSPPKAMINTPFLYNDGDQKAKTSGTRDVYNMETQLLSRALDGKMSKRNPFVRLEDIRKRRPSDVTLEDPYLLNTQPMAKAGASNVYDLDTQRLSGNDTLLPEGDVSLFNPKINSTSLQHGGKQSTGPGLEISPSTSNKENRTSDADRTGESSETDDEFGLSETIPISTLFRQIQPKGVNSSVNKEKQSERKFKIPLHRADGTETPKPKTKDRKRRSTEMSEFLTPEHPLLYLAKADCVRSTVSSRHAAARKPAYHFNDSSSSSDDDANDRNLFKKTNVSVALEKELEKVRQVGAMKKEHDRAAAKVKQAETKEVKGRDESSIKKATVSINDQQKELKPSEKHVEAVERKSSRRTRQRENDKEKVSSEEKISSRLVDRTEDKDRHKKSHKSEEYKPEQKRSVSQASGDQINVSEEKKSNRMMDGRYDKEHHKYIHKTEEDKQVKRNHVEEKESLKEKKSSRTTDRKENKERHQNSNKSEDDIAEQKRLCTRASAERTKSTDIEHPTRVSTRIRYKTYKMQQTNVSVDYSAPTANPTRPYRKRKDVSSTEQEASVTRTSESKRQKPSHSSATSSASSASTTRGAKKVVETSSDLSGGQGSTIGSKSDHDLLGDISLNSNSKACDVSAVMSARSSRPRLTFTRLSADPYRECVARAGVKIVSALEQATIVVAGRISHTTKFLCASARGIPIVGQSYLDALQRSNENESINPWDHILTDSNYETRYKFRLRDTLLKARKHRLFQGYTVYVTPNTTPPKAELYLMVSYAGGKATTNYNQPPKDANKVFVISNPTDAKLWIEYKERFPSIEIVSTE
uniref:PAX-interacting protein 1 n=1 Tax=Anopheles epiroticus TaxID=199890 RepID=A0A182PB59_9DIPT